MRTHSTSSAERPERFRKPQISASSGKSSCLRSPPSHLRRTLSFTRIFEKCDSARSRGAARREISCYQNLLRRVKAMHLRSGLRSRSAFRRYWQTVNPWAKLGRVLAQISFTMRRLSLAWIISFLLVFAQHGAVLHEISHLHFDPAESATLHQSQEAADASLCPTCQAFAQIANPATGAATAVAVCPAPYLLAPAPRDGNAVADAPIPCSRGPPQV
jgi:hypothetical protein